MPSLDEPDDQPGTEYWTIRKEHVLLIWEALLIGTACAKTQRITEREIDILARATLRLRELFPETQP